MIKRQLDQAREAICPGAYLDARVGPPELEEAHKVTPLFIQ